MKWGRGVAGVLAVFAVGMAFGWLAAHAAYKKKVDNMLKGAPEAFQEVIVKRLNKKLKLDREQENQLRAILRETHDQMSEAREEVTPETQEILREAKDRVKKILRPDQMNTFEKMAAENRAGRLFADDAETVVVSTAPRP